jgi:hypothetical protein
MFLVAHDATERVERRRKSPQLGYNWMENEVTPDNPNGKHI